MKNKWLYLIGLAIAAELLYFFWPSPPPPTAEPTAIDSPPTAAEPTAADCPHLPNGMPEPKPQRIVVRDIYCFAPNPETKFPSWVAYTVSRETMGNGGGEQSRDWQPDPDPTIADLVLEPEDFEGGYQALGVDRGHLVPLASFRGANWEQVNYMSVIVPQRSALNRGAWAQLEDQVRDMAKVSPVNVLAGTDYDRSLGVLPNADEPHQIPSGLWMVVSQNKTTAAYYFDQDSDQNVQEAIVTIPELQARVGLNIP